MRGKKRYLAIILILTLIMGQAMGVCAEENQEEAIETQTAGDNTLTVYEGYPIIIETGLSAGEGYAVNNYNSSCCNASIVTNERCTEVYLKLEGTQQGYTEATLSQYGSAFTTYHINVVPLPEDAADIEDTVLRSELIHSPSGFDANQDGYISTGEMESLEYVTFDGKIAHEVGIETLNGLEAAKNLQSISLNGISTLRDINALYQLQNLVFANLHQTGVSTEDKWNLLKFEDMEITVGKVAVVPYPISGVFWEGVKTEILQGQEYLTAVPDTDYNPADTILTALKPGEAKLRISYQEYSAEFTVRVVEEKVDEQTAYIGYPVLLESGFYPYEGCTVECEDPSICEASIAEKEENASDQTYVKLDGKKEGETLITVRTPGMDVLHKYRVTVKPLPTDAAPIEDIVLRTVLIRDYDEQQDGYVSMEELEKVTALYCPGMGGITDDISIESLAGLENAKNLKHVMLSYNSQLSKIDALFQLKNLKEVYLHDTKVSDEDRWKLMLLYTDNWKLNKGDKIKFPRVEGVITDGMNVNEISQELRLETQVSSSGNSASLLARKIGDTELQVDYKEFSAKIPITVCGIDENQETGETYDEIVNGSNYSNTLENDEDMKILNSNGELWSTYPEVEKIQEGVKAYSAGYVYSSGNQADEFRYILDEENALWAGETCLAEDVVAFDGRYAKNSEGELINVYDIAKGGISQVSDWISPEQSQEEANTYVLRADGSLWSKKEEKADPEISAYTIEENGGFAQIDETVTQIMKWGYLKQDGTVVTFNGTETASKGESLLQSEQAGLASAGYYGTDHIFYLSQCIDGEPWSQFSAIGEIEPEKMFFNPDYKENGMTGYFLTKTGGLYRYNFAAENLEHIATDVKQVSSGEEEWCYQNQSGAYYGYDNEMLENPNIKTMLLSKEGETIGEYTLVKDESTEGYILRKNTVNLLTQVKEVWSSQGNIYALRVDGSVWNVTNIPKELLELNNNNKKKGDVNEDGAVNIQDLRIILRGVCEKIELTDTQKSIADVTGDGIVNIQDLRKVLRYVCGKITEL